MQTRIRLPDKAPICYSKRNVYHRQIRKQYYLGREMPNIESNNNQYYQTPLLSFSFIISFPSYLYHSFLLILSTSTHIFSNCFMLLSEILLDSTPFVTLFR
eukprot:GDKJ01032173.1.p2 GENE.GDKJ01032173.1~~GDKJ01032173.1.p2  ORF type:complete len:101 (-),score=2.60 GDKJ01032173.1:204-506(-)